MGINNIPTLILVIIVFFSLQFSAISTDNLPYANDNGISLITSIKAIFDTFNDLLAIILQFVFTILITFLLFKLVVWIKKDEAMLVFPFEVANSDDKYNGKSISIMLISELNNREQSIKNQSSTIGSKGSSRDKVIIPEISISDEKTSIPQLGTVGIGNASVSIGELMSTVKYIFCGSGKKITGSLEKNGSHMKLIACLSGNPAGSWVVQKKTNVKANETMDFDKKAESDKENYLISDLVKSLSYEIAYHLFREHIFTKTMIGFRYYTEALDSYKKYAETNEMEYLQLSRDNCLEANRIDPGNDGIIKLFYDLGIEYYYRQNYYESEMMLQYAVESRYNYAIAWNALGAALQGQGAHKYEDALNAYDKAISSYNDYVDAFQQMGTNLFSQGKEEEAFSVYGIADDLRTRASSYLADFWSNKGQVQSLLEQYDMALVSYKNAINLNPNSAYAWDGKGTMLNRLGKHEEALKACIEATRLNPEIAYMWDGKGLVLYSMQRYNEAIEAYDRAISLDPRFADAWFGRGEALSGLGDKYYEKALKDYDKAIKLNPNLVYAWHGKGCMLGNLGRYEEAIEAFNNAIELDQERSKPLLEEKNAIEILIEEKKSPNARKGEIKLDQDCAEYYYKKAMKQ